MDEVEKIQALREHLVNTIADIQCHIGSALTSVESVQRREELVSKQEASCNDLIKVLKLQTDTLEEREKKCTARESALADVRTELAQVRAQNKGLRAETTDLDAKLQTARKECGEYKARIAAIEKAFPGLAVAKAAPTAAV